MKRFIVLCIRLTAIILVCLMLSLSCGTRPDGICEAGYEHENIKDRAPDKGEYRHEENIKDDKSGSTERILQCYNRINEDELDDIPDKLFSMLDNADKIKAMLFAMRIGPVRRELIMDLIEKGINRDGMETICGILSECLSSDEMNQLADMAEKYTDILNKRSN